jgi:hypothetical protein
MIKEAYCSFEVAKLLKEKGFPQKYDIYHSMVYNEEDYEDECEVQRMVVRTKLVKAGTLSSYPVGVPEPKCYCPTHQMAMAWLREKHNLYIGINIEVGDIQMLPSYDFEETVLGYTFVIYDKETLIWVFKDKTPKSYEDAVEAALKYCLENLI